MTVVTKTEYSADAHSFYNLKANSWSGAIDTLNDIERAGLEEDFMEYLEEVFGDEEIDETELNDFCWFERDEIYEALRLDENGELKDEEEDD